MPRDIDGNKMNIGDVVQHHNNLLWPIVGIIRDVTIRARVTMVIVEIRHDDHKIHQPGETATFLPSELVRNGVHMPEGRNRELRPICRN